jgi:hypothetical protein
MKKLDDVREAVTNTLLHDARLYGALVHALEARAQFDKGQHPDKYRAGDARMLLGAALDAAAVLVGREAMALAYGEDPGADAPREEHLIAMWWRLQLIESVYGVDATHSRSPSSLTALGDDIMAIAKGDRPTVLVEPQSVNGRPVNAWRLAKRQMAALEWETHLRAQGMPTAQAQNAVSSAFCSTWTTIRRWKIPATRELGDDMYTHALRGAQKGYGVYSRIGRSYLPEEEALQEDAKAYWDERRRILSVVE